MKLRPNLENFGLQEDDVEITEVMAPVGMFALLARDMDASEGALYPLVYKSSRWQGCHVLVD